VSQSPAGEPVRPDRLLRTIERLLAIAASELEPALAEAAQIVAEVLGADKVDVFLYEAATESLVARGTSQTPMGSKQRQIGMHRLPVAGGGRAVEVFQTGVAYRTGHADADPRELVGVTQGLGVRSEVTVALDVGGRRRGVLSAVSAQADFFSDADQEFLQAVSHWTGLVMHRAELTHELMAQAEERGRRQMLEQLLGNLTQRQLEVAVLIASGLSNQQIAQHLVLTTGTVANHIAQVLDRLGLENRTQVAALIAEVGLHRGGRASGAQEPEP
jgi:two-component system, OmpR family, sensor kinase